MSSLATTPVRDIIGIEKGKREKGKGEKGKRGKREREGKRATKKHKAQLVMLVRIH
jgi:hypothetical protein